MSGTGRHARERERHSEMPSPRGTAGRAAPDARPAVRALDPAELMWLAEARELLRGPGLDLTDVDWLGTHLDTLMRRWHAEPAATRWDPTPTTTAIGLAVGDAVVEQVPGLHWVRLLDPVRSPFALAHPAATAIDLPIDAVLELWHDGRPGRLPALVASLVDAAEARTADAPVGWTGALRLLTRRLAVS